MTVESLLERLPLLYSLCFGAVYTFFGYRFLKFQLIFAGCFLGFNIGFIVSNSVIPGKIIPALITGLIGLLIVGILFSFLYKLAIFCVGFAVGVLITPAVLAQLPSALPPIVIQLIVVFAGIFLGIVAIQIQRKFLTVFTSLIGAFGTSISLLLLIGEKHQPTTRDFNIVYKSVIHDYLWLVVGLTLAGILIQLRRRENEKLS